MSWIERSVEERLAKAAAAGELDTPHLRGHELDLDRRRGDGWWADQLVRRERSHDRRTRELEAAATARAGFWRAEREDEVRRLVGVANAAIESANLNMLESDRIDPFDADDIVGRWRELRAR